MLHDKAKTTSQGCKKMHFHATTLKSGHGGRQRRPTHASLGPTDVLQAGATGLEELITEGSQRKLKMPR